MTSKVLSSESVAEKTIALGVPKGARVAVAVSGGADSVALAVLLRDHFDVVALTVDHGLRTESADEAKLVHDRLSGLGITHHTLVWQHQSHVPHSNVQAQAREARYQLMADWCQKQGISCLLTAHHRDDQAETLLLRLARGSGVYGLAAMEPVRVLSPQMKLFRPLLDVAKDQIIATLKTRGIDWIEDPSNEQDVFERVKARKLLRNPPLEGLTAERLASTAARLRRTREAMQYYENLWLDEAVCFHDAGYAELKVSCLNAAPVEIVLRGLTSVLRFAGGGNYGPRFEKLERLLAELRSTSFKGQTLGGVQFCKPTEGIIVVVREIAAAMPPKEVDGTSFWDARFDVSCAAKSTISETPLSIGMLGQLSHTSYKASLKEDLSRLGLSIPSAVVLDTLPVFFDTERLIAVPHLGYNPGNVNLPLLTHRWLSLSKSGEGLVKKSDM